MIYQIGGLMLFDVGKFGENFFEKKFSPKKCIQYFIRLMYLNYTGLDLFFPLKL